MLLLTCLVFFNLLVFVNMSSQPTITWSKGSALIYGHVILLILVGTLNRFLLVEISDTQKYVYVVIVVFIFKCVNVDDIEKKKKPIIFEVWANNYEWMKCDLRLCQREAQTTRNYKFFRNLCQYKKIYITNFV